MPYASQEYIDATAGQDRKDLRTFLYAAHTYYDDSGALITTPNDFNFPDSIFTDCFLHWVMYTAATEKKPEKYTIHEPRFIEVFRKYYHLNRIHGQFYDQFGPVDDGTIRANIQDWITAFFSTNIAKISLNLFNALCNYCNTELPPLKDDTIYCADGHTITIEKDGTITDTLDLDAITVNRLPVKYDKDAAHPEMFTKYLFELLSVSDAQTLLEYIGYMLVPTTKCQKALFLRCEGGGGKSVLLDILSRMFGNSATSGSLSYLATNRFALAVLENKLAFFDDDLNTSLLEETATIKKIVTANAPMIAERKGKEAFQFQPYARLLCAGNVFPGAAHDRSNGLYRRLILLECKARPEGRIDDPDLARKIIDNELPGILNMAIGALTDLMRNGFVIHQSEESKQILERKRLEDNPVEQFLTDTDWLAEDADAFVSSAAIVDAFKVWCVINAVVPPKDMTITKTISHYADVHKHKYCTLNQDGHRKRGYTGITLTAYAQQELRNSAGQTNQQIRYATR